MRVAILDNNLNVLSRESVPTGIDSRADDSCRLMIQMIDSGRRQVGLEVLSGVGISAPSVDRRSGSLINPPNLPNWHGYSISKFVKNQLGLPVFIGNDASLAALGEHRLGAGNGVENMLYYTLSTGIGGGIIIGGRLYEGKTGFAGEFGHMTVDPEGRACKCGNRGCLELYASGPSIVKEAWKAMENGRATSLSREGTPSTLSVFEASGTGDGLCSEVIGRAGKYLGIGILGVMHAFEPERIVIGGGVSAGFDQLIPYVEQHVRDHAMAQFKGNMDIRVAALGEDSSLIGAACYLLDNLHTP